MSIRLSILDQSPVYPGDTPHDSLQRTVKLAQKAEELGYKRFWVSEHHDTDLLAGSSPEVLISYLLARTERIRVGSGGIMLQHYSPYKVAENFNVLASLAPGRVDLGIGRAPGGFPRSTQALQQGVTEKQPLESKLAQLEQYLQGPLGEGHELEGLKAAPITGEPASIYLLGTSPGSAELAAEGGRAYVFAQFINSDPEAARTAFDLYRSKFKGEKPLAILAISAIVADTDEEAAELAGEFKNVKLLLEDGRKINVGSVEQAEAFAKQAGLSYTVEVRDADITKGSKETVRRRLLELQAAYGVDEFIVTNAVKDFDKRVRSYELLSEAFAELAVEG
ncbi:LLM class flavin-dependent oxidoreductase [Paenibacillus protaetiae]|uniref:LLM class flavin-dependent oxidoreductase n=1 Tax=Paenibacillus protaetiae TaxID=2509456 RepID=A0A4P6EVZ5_9BACL|nr:LLM class flavin-dependent oxidoreductase [Paenibacillus protaetiae]QAY67184.1 LLM class flavin-dependent oxidoreductase [Paenibacillus protaetiae]